MFPKKNSNYFIHFPSRVRYNFRHVNYSIQSFLTISFINFRVLRYSVYMKNIITFRFKVNKCAKYFFKKHIQIFPISCSVQFQTFKLSRTMSSNNFLNYFSSSLVFSLHEIHNFFPILGQQMCEIFFQKTYSNFPSPVRYNFKNCIYS